MITRLIFQKLNVTLIMALILMTGCVPVRSLLPTQVGKTVVPPEVGKPVVLPGATEISEANIPQDSSIVLVIPESPPSFNPAVGDTGYDSLIMEMVMLGMTSLTPDGIVIAELAESLPTVENGGVSMDEEASTMDVTWNLRKDVQWQDGKPVTSNDVIFTYEAIINPETGIWIPGLDYIDGVEKVDDYGVVVHYNTIYPGYLTQFGSEEVAIWPEHYCDPKQGFTAWDCALQPLSNGPYILEEWEAGDHLTFVRNPNYYQKGKPEIDEIVVKIIPDAATRQEMLIQGEADVFVWLTELDAWNLIKESHITLSFPPSDRWAMRLIFNLAGKGFTDPATNPHPILSDVRVRRAIRLAIDADLISKEIFYGFSAPVWTEFYRPPYQCEVPQLAYDPEKAGGMLDAAGWKDLDGDGIRECHGCLNAEEGYPMTMEMITYAEYGDSLVHTQQIIAEMLNKIGIGLKLTVVEGSLLWGDYASGGIEQTGNFDIDLYDDGYSGNDPTDFLWEYYASAASVPDSGGNVGRWSDLEFDELLDSTYTLDEAHRQATFCQMANILNYELPQILLFSVINADAYNHIRVAGIQSNANGVVTWNVADWTLVK